jgi:hypothetical protein
VFLIKKIKRVGAPIWSKKPFLRFLLNFKLKSFNNSGDGGGGGSDDYEVKKHTLDPMNSSQNKHADSSAGACKLYTCNWERWS